MIGALAFIAMSWIFTIFCAWVSESEPPNTVKSLANTKVLRPLTVPQPVTTPSPGTLVFSMPNSTERCSTNMSNSSNEPLSSSTSMRFSPPPSLAPARRSSRVSRISFMWCFPARFARVLTRHFAGGKRRCGIWHPCPAHDISRASTEATFMTDIAGAETTGAVTGGLRTLLRLEGLTLFTGMTLLYAVWGGSWWIYAIVFLAPDLSFVAYLADPRTGAIIYNAAHSYMAPMTLMVTGLALASPLVLSIAMIWLAHIGIDRALGYGLKYNAGFGFTHLGRIGKDAVKT